MSAMTFAQFQATGRDVADLSAIASCAAQELGGAGRIYLDDEWPLVIETDLARGWVLTIGNSSECYGVLFDAERELYEFAVSEGYISIPETKVKS